MKYMLDFLNIVLVVVNLDLYYIYVVWLELVLDELGLDLDQLFQVHDLVSEVCYLWQGCCNYVEFNLVVVLVHIFCICCKVWIECDFD